MSNDVYYNNNKPNNVYMANLINQLNLDPLLLVKLRALFRYAHENNKNGFANIPMSMIEDCETSFK